MNLIREAQISRCGLYRYDLYRRWGIKPGFVLWVMLNPSTADAAKDDATIRKCIGFSDRLGFHALHVVNLFAFRATDPEELARAADPIGEQADFFISLRSHSHGVQKIIFAWGAPPNGLAERARLRISQVAFLIGKSVFCLGRTLSGDPRHPSRLCYDAQLLPFSHELLPANVESAQTRVSVPHGSRTDG